MLAVAALLLTASCSAITSPGRFTFEGDTGPECPPVDESDLGIELRNFETYANDQIEIRVVTTDERQVLRAVLDGLDEEGVSADGTDNAALLCLRFPELVELHGSLVVRTFVDNNIGFDGVFQQATEPGWQDVAVDGVAVVDGSEGVTGWDDELIPPPGDFELNVTGMLPHIPGTQHIAAMIIDDTGIPVGFYRIADLDDADFQIYVQQILEPDRDYTLEFYADYIPNGFYDPIPMGDHAWLETYRSDGDGNVVEAFAHNTDFDLLDAF
jgi:hypothetical protein